jgi:hypothetical protein
MPKEAEQSLIERDAYWNLNIKIIKIMEVIIMQTPCSGARGRQT